MVSKEVFTLCLKEFSRNGINNRGAMSSFSILPAMLNLISIELPCLNFSKSR